MFYSLYMPEDYILFFIFFSIVWINLWIVFKISKKKNEKK
jgi:hypothetical protein